MVGVSTMRGTVLKGSSVRKVENHWAYASMLLGHPVREQKSGFLTEV